MKSRQAYRDIILGKHYAEKCNKSTSLQIKPQHWGDKRQLSMEGISLEYNNNYTIIRDVN